MEGRIVSVVVVEDDDPILVSFCILWSTDGKRNLLDQVMNEKLSLL